MANKQRKRRRVATKTGILARWAGTGLFLCTVFACVFVSELFKDPVVLPPCVPSGMPDVVFSEKIDGKLRRNGREYVLRDAQGNDRTLAIVRRGNAPPLYYILKQYPEGAAAHAEFCGPFLTSVSLNGVPVHTAQPPTQAAIDQKAKALRSAGRYSLGFLVAVVLGLILFCAKKIRLARARR